MVTSSPDASRTMMQIQEKIIDIICHEMQVPRTSVGAGEAFVQLGLDSFSFLNILGQLEDWLDMELDLNELAACKTIAALAEKLDAMQQA